MKILFAPIIIFLSLCFYPVILNAQDTPWLEVGSEWTYQHGFIDGPDLYQVKYGITEETTHAGKSCYKMEKLDFGGGLLGCMALQAPFYFYVSNDSLYYSVDELDYWRLAIDFGAEPGDSWDFVTGMGTTTLYTAHVDSVNDIEVEGHTLRQLVISYSFDIESGDPYKVELYPETIIVTEVIGAADLFFVPFGKGAACDMHWGEKLHCFSSPSFDYFNPPFENCELFTSVESMEEIGVHIFPNPAVNRVHLAASHGQPLERVDIFSLSGKRVINHSPQSGNVWLDVSALPAGMYLIHVHSASGLHVAKIMKE
jgi:hypothetical protein